MRTFTTGNSDTLNRIAAATGFTIQNLVDANPGANLRDDQLLGVGALDYGVKINVPDGIPPYPAVSSPFAEALFNDLAGASFNTFLDVNRWAATPYSQTELLAVNPTYVDKDQTALLDGPFNIPSPTGYIVNGSLDPLPNLPAVISATAQPPSTPLYQDPKIWFILLAALVAAYFILRKKKGS